MDLQHKSILRGTDKVGRSIRSRDVINVLRELFMVRGVPTHIRSDNGPEFIAKAVRDWLAEHRVGPDHKDLTVDDSGAHLDGPGRGGCLLPGR